MKRGKHVLSLSTETQQVADTLTAQSDDIEGICAGSGRGKSVLAANVGEELPTTVFELVATVARYHKVAFEMVSHHHPRDLNSMS